MNYEHTIRILVQVSKQDNDVSSKELAINIISHIDKYGGSMVTMNMLDVSSIIKIAYASEMTKMGMLSAYGKMTDLYNWMIETRGSNYVIELQSNVISLPISCLTVYSDTLPHIDGFLDIQLAISGSTLTTSRIQDLELS